MHERRLEPEMIRQMLDWLGRNMDVQKDVPEVLDSAVLTFTEEDREFLRRFRIVPA